MTLDDIRKSISSTLYEKTTSPLFGTFLFSWILWNWKIIIVLFFTASYELEITKFEYIDINLLNILEGLLYPFISTLIILTIYSALSVQAYRLWLYFDKLKSKYKNENEKDKLLTVEQSMKLRVQFSNQEDSFKNLINEKEELISALKNKISELNNESKDEVLSSSNESSELTLTDPQITKSAKERNLDDFFTYKTAVNYFEQVSILIQNKRPFGEEQIPDSVISYYIAHDLIVSSDDYGRYDFSTKGRDYLREYYRRSVKESFSES